MFVVGIGLIFWLKAKVGIIGRHVEMRLGD